MTTEVERRPARVKISFARKYNLGQYENMDIMVGAEDDCMKGESIEKGLDRLTGTVQTQFETLCGKIEGNKKGGKSK